MILYYTCSGNSEYIAKKMAVQLNETPVCINHDVIEGLSGTFCSETPFIIVCPIFNMRAPIKVEEYLKNSTFSGSNEVVFVAVCSYSSGNARGYLRSIFKSKNMRMFYTAVIMPSSNAFKPNTTSDNSRAKIVDRAEKETLRLSYVIKNNAPIAQTAVSLVGVIGSSLNPLILKTFTDKRLRVNDKCTKCGKCVSGCPTKNIEFDNSAVSFKGNCIHCSLCVNTCPEKAIFVGKQK